MELRVLDGPVVEGSIVTAKATLSVTLADGGK
jgi:hypothetical protein